MMPNESMKKDAYDRVDAQWRWRANWLLEYVNAKATAGTPVVHVEWESVDTWIKNGHL